MDDEQLDNDILIQAKDLPSSSLTSALDITKPIIYGVVLRITDRIIVLGPPGIRKGPSYEDRKTTLHSRVEHTVPLLESM